MNVPLDHDQLAGARTQIAMVRLPASNPSERIGSLFINPGGPGGSGVDVVLFAGPSLFPAPVNERFDLVGFDPRGVARSAGVRCLPNERRWWDVFATPYDGALAVADLLPNSHLITVNGSGHVAAGTSVCATFALVDYLVTQQAPAVDTCAQDYTPFVDRPAPWIFVG